MYEGITEFGKLGQARALGFIRSVVYQAVKGSSGETGKVDMSTCRADSSYMCSII